MSIEYRYVRPKKAEILQQMNSQEFVNRTDLSCIYLNNALVLPVKKDSVMPFGLGGVVDESGEYVQESGIPYRFGGGYDNIAEQYIDKKVVYCGCLVNHWGHFLIESVARLWYFLKNDSSIDEYVFVSEFSNKSQIKGNYKEFLELLGIYDRVQIVSKPTRFREVILPELGYMRGGYYSEDYKKIFNVIRDRALVKKNFYIIEPERLFLSRSIFAKKSEAGVDMLDDFFLRNNYYVLRPENVSLSEIICLLNSVKTCAAESGTLPHNFLFCEDGKEVLIIERQDTVNETQIDIDRMKKLQVTYIDGFYTIYPVAVSFGPYYLAYNDYMKKYAQDYMLMSPSPRYLSERYSKKCISKYMRVYRSNYGYMWGIGKWQVTYAPLFWESYSDTCLDIGEYLSGRKAFKVSQCFRISYLKRMLSRIIRGLK